MDGNRSVRTPPVKHRSGLLGYNSLPYNLRSQYGPQLDPYSRYAYDNNYLYRVDPRTLIVQQVLSAILR